MPVELLTDEQVAAYDQWIGPTPRAQLERCLVLDHNDLVLVLRRRSQRRLDLEMARATPFGRSPVLPHLGLWPRRLHGRPPCGPLPT
jgi:hypothetical protein